MTHQQGGEGISKILRGFGCADNQAIESFLRQFEPFEVRRKELITAAGKPERYLYFVLEGVQRIFFDDGNHRPATLLFTYAPSFGGVLDSLLLQVPAKYNYEALTQSRFLRAPQSAVLQTMEKFPAIGAAVRTGVTFSLSGILDRVVELESFSAEERFKNLLARSPHLLQLVPHKYLANYIGIDVTNFSKLINSVKL